MHRIVESRTTPVINTGLVHRTRGVGQVGAGLAELPIAPFEAASAALATRPGGE